MAVRSHPLGTPASHRFLESSTSTTPAVLARDMIANLGPWNSSPHATMVLLGPPDTGNHLAIGLAIGVPGRTPGGLRHGL